MDTDSGQEEGQGWRCTSHGQCVSGVRAGSPDFHNDTANECLGLIKNQDQDKNGKSGQTTAMETAHAHVCADELVLTWELLRCRHLCRDTLPTQKTPHWVDSLPAKPTQ